jgi:Tfp pilus assembly protein PilF
MQLMAVLFLLAATIVLYAPAGKLSFISYDDPAYVTENAHVSAGLSGANAAWAFTALAAENWHPLTWLSHMADCQLFGIDPAAHHCINVLFHAANVVLLFLLLLKATGYLWRSFLVSALFAFHPINVQSVAWVAERKNLLSTFLLLIALWGYGWYIKNPGWKRYLAVAAAFAASLMAKPMAVTFPFVLLLLDYWPLGRLPDPAEASGGAAERPPAGWWRQLWRLTVEKSPLAVLSVASCWITMVAQKRGGAMHLETPLKLSTRLGNAMYSYFEYVRMMFWPSGLGIFYPYPKLSFAAVALSALFVVGLTVLVVVLRRRKYLFCGWFLFLGTLVPVIGLVQVGRQGMADRYAYIPLIGLFVIAVWLAAEAIAAFRIPQIATVLFAGGLLLAAGVATRTNLQYWQDSITVFNRASEVASRPDSMIEVNLGQALFTEDRVEESLEHYHRAEQVDPQSAVVHYNIAVAYMRQSQLAAAAEEFQKAIQYARPNDLVAVNALNNLGAIYLQTGDLTESWKDYSSVLQMDPNHFPARLGRGLILFRQARYPEASDEIARAILISSSPDAWFLLSRALQAQGKKEQAAEAYQRGMQLSR